MAISVFSSDNDDNDTEVLAPVFKPHQQFDFIFIFIVIEEMTKVTEFKVSWWNVN